MTNIKIEIIKTISHDKEVFQVVQLRNGKFINTLSFITEEATNEYIATAFNFHNFHNDNFNFEVEVIKNERV